MTTKMVRDSIVGDDWILQTMRNVPVQRIIDPATGNFNGDIITGPVRLAFDNLFDLPPANETNKNPKYGTQLLFPPNVDFTIFYEEYYKACAQHFPENYVPETQQYMGLHSPFRDQAEKLKFGGYTPGCVFMTVSSKYKPPVVDSRMNPIVDKTKVYPGVWAICVVNTYDYGKNPPQPKKGINFGLQSVMIIGDDTKFGNQGPDVKAQFKGVNVTAPIVRPGVGAGMAGMNPAAPAPAAAIPGYTQPGGGVARPGMPGQVPHVPQTHYVPPAPAADDEDDMSLYS